MTTEEFSTGMDVALNSYALPTPFGEAENKLAIQLNEYEKSWWLTKAQEEYVLSIYTGRNPTGESFESTEEMRRYLSALITEDEISPETKDIAGVVGVGDSTFFVLSDDVWFITYEAVKLEGATCDSLSTIEVVPVTQDEYHRIKKNPFRGANKRRALRLDLPDNMVEIVCKNPISKYYVRYLRRPQPIIVANLDGETICCRRNVTECELPESLHQKILDLAVQMAAQSKGYNRITNNENK